MPGFLLNFIPFLSRNRLLNRFETRYATIIRLHRLECKRLNILIEGRNRNNSPAEVTKRVITIEDVNEPLTKEQSEDRINILLTILAFVLLLILLTFFVAIIGRQPTKPFIVLPKIPSRERTKGFPIQMIGILNHGNLFTLGSQKSALNMTHLPRPGSNGLGEIFPIFNLDQLWFVYSDPSKPIILYDIMGGKHTKLSKISHIQTDNLISRSMGVRLGHHLWILGQDQSNAHSSLFLGKFIQT